VVEVFEGLGEVVLCEPDFLEYTGYGLLVIGFPVEVGKNLECLDAAGSRLGLGRSLMCFTVVSPYGSDGLVTVRAMQESLWLGVDVGFAAHAG